MGFMDALHASFLPTILALVGVTLFGALVGAVGQLRWTHKRRWFR